jgi:hypothetical protein
LDSIRYEQPVADRFDNEPDNKLNIQYDFVNDPIQADVIARTELKQARVNKSISFTTDFTNLDVAPGDIIDVTIDYWGWNQKLFRVVELTQTDTAEGQLLIDVVAIEYDPEVYNYNNLSRYSRTLDVGNLVPVENNAPAQTNKDETTGSQFSRAMTDPDFYASTIQPAFVAQNYSTFDTVDDNLPFATWELYTDTIWAGEGLPPSGTNQTFTRLVPVGNSSMDPNTPIGKLLRIYQQQPYGTGMYVITTGTTKYAQRLLGYFPLHWDLQYRPFGGTYDWIRAYDPQFNQADFTFEIEDPLPGEYLLSWNTDYSTELVGVDITNQSGLGFNITYQTGTPGSYTNTTLAALESTSMQFVGTNYTGCSVSAPGFGVVGYGTIAQWSLFLN